ncbi:hypothetical protein, partial [Oenococcus oeni]|uniref:hypothetical protein n=1 Tax=Oenococcus oeni TaxID=1247 RepID=UPI001C5B4BD0
MGYYFKVQNYRRIGLDLHAARIMLGWGTGELASLSGVDEKTIIRIESLKPHDKLSVNLEHVS